MSRSDALRTLFERAEQHGGEETRRLRDRLVRDLLPRTVGGTPYVVAGIVGPNNAGKSALFNGIVGRDLSPSLPTGGATRRLYGATSTSLADRLANEPALERFRVVRARDLDPRELEARANPSEGDDPGELLLFDVELPDGLLLIDTPDFDSVMERNRLASESLLAVADLAIAVVTRHTNQNREVVDFLRRWLAHGRPWLLVYNESPSVEVALEHARKLANDVEAEPLAVFQAPHDLRVQEGEAPLRVTNAAELQGASVGALSLGELLADLEHVGAVKERALAASVAQLLDDVAEWRRELDAESAAARELLEAATTRTRAVARRIGSSAMPGGPFIEAFRTVLDRRTNRFSRTWRYGLRKARLKIESLPSLFSGSKPDGDSVRAGLAEVERAELERAWPSLWETLARDLGAEGRVAARASATDELRAALDADLDEARGSAAREACARAVEHSSAGLEAFQDVCEVLVEEAIVERGKDWDIQAAADVAMLAPIAIATAVIIKTGGLGSDVGVAGGAALSSYLFEKYSHLLGTRITTEASRRWASQREAELAPVLLEAALPSAASALREKAEGAAELSDELAALAREIAADENHEEERA